MTQNQYNEKIAKIQNTTIKATQDLSKKAGESAKKISLAHSSLTHSVVKNLQKKSIEILAIKSPVAIVDLLNNESSNELMKEMNEYQNELKNIFKKYTQDMSEYSDELLMQTKTGIDEWFNTTIANVPNGNGIFIKPYQSVINATLLGLEQVVNLSKNINNSMELKADEAISSKGFTGNSRDQLTK